MIVHATEFHEGIRHEVADLAQPARDGAFTFIAIVEPDRAELDSIAGRLELHELAVEDVVEAAQRPKVEIYEESIFVVAYTARLGAPGSGLVFGELHFLVSANAVLIVGHDKGAGFEDIVRTLEEDSAAVAAGPMGVLRAALNGVVESYAAVVDAIEDTVEEVEESVFSDGVDDVANRVYAIQRSVLAALGRSRPLLGALTTLEAGRVPLPTEELYYRDMVDNLTRAIDHFGTQRELLTAMLQANLTQVSVELARVGVQQNDDMRRISAWVAVAAAPTLIAGVYGMNFRHMPELSWTLGYPFALAVMVATSAILYWLLRRARWL